MTFRFQVNLNLNENLKLFLKAFPNLILNFPHFISFSFRISYSKENQIPLIREVENELINFLRDSYGIGKRFTACHQLLTDFNIIVHQFAENCLNNHPAKYVIKPDSFLIRIMNKSSSFSTEVVNGRVIRTSIPKNPRIRIKFTREKVTILNNQQNIILDNFIQMRLQQRYILFILRTKFF